MTYRIYVGDGFVLDTTKETDMHTKEVICWQCKAPNQAEDNTPELLEALETISETTGVSPSDAVAMMDIATEAIRKEKEKRNGHRIRESI
jgi:hypothetical protein